MNIERKCNNCTYYPCLRIDCRKENVCGQHTLEHEKMIEEIEKSFIKIEEEK